MGLNIFGGGKSTSYQADTLDPESLGGLKNAVKGRSDYQGSNLQEQQQILSDMLDRYGSGELDKVLQERVAQQSAEAQNRMLGQAATKAGSAFNTAAQAAAQKATASALSEINVNAEQARQQYLTNLLDQYGNQTADYMNLLNTLSGQKQTLTESKQYSNIGGDLLKAGIQGASFAMLAGA